MMVSPFDLMRASLALFDLKQASEPAWGPKPRAALKPVKRAGVKAARKQRLKAKGRG
jgi:hypothetical protein